MDLILWNWMNGDFDFMGETKECVFVGHRCRVPCEPAPGSDDVYHEIDCEYDIGGES